MVDAVWISNLIRVLELENKLYAQILEEAEKKTDIIVKGDVQALEEITIKEQKIVGELGKLNNAREQITVQIARKLGKKPGEITASGLAEMLPGDQAKRLLNVRGSLRETIEKLQSRNDINQKLLNNAIEYINFSLNLFMQPAPQTAQYGRKGLENQINSGNVLDIKY